MSSHNLASWLGTQKEIKKERKREREKERKTE